MDIKQLKQLIKEAQGEMLQERQSYLLDHPGIVNEELLDEGVYDKGILKAVFTAGGPGSGKSYVADVMFDAREAGQAKTFDASSFGGGYGLKYVNSDNLFEIWLKKMGNPLADLGGLFPPCNEAVGSKGEEAATSSAQTGLLGD